MQPLRWSTSPSSPILAEFGQYRAAMQRAAMHAQVSFAYSTLELPLQPESEPDVCYAFLLGINKILDIIKFV